MCQEILKKFEKHIIFIDAEQLFIKARQYTLIIPHRAIQLTTKAH